MESADLFFIDSFTNSFSEATPKVPAFSQGGKTSESPSGDLETLDRVEIPKMFKVLLLNDDFTPMDFVVLVLQRFFGKSLEAATEVMLDVHQKGSGTAGVYTLEVAEMKAHQVNQFSRMNQHPLKCVWEAE